MSIDGESSYESDMIIIYELSAKGYMEKQYIKKIKVYGSGSNGLLLTGGIDDILEVKEVDVAQYRMRKIGMGGMFALAANTNDEVIVWGSFDNQIITVPKSIGVVLAVASISCGWDHSVLLTTNK